MSLVQGKAAFTSDYISKSLGLSMSDVIRTLYAMYEEGLVNFINSTSPFYIPLLNMSDILKEVSYE